MGLIPGPFFSTIRSCCFFYFSSKDAVFQLGVLRKEGSLERTEMEGTSGKLTVLCSRSELNKQNPENTNQKTSPAKPDLRADPGAYLPICKAFSMGKRPKRLGAQTKKQQQQLQPDSFATQMALPNPKSERLKPRNLGSENGTLFGKVACEHSSPPGPPHFPTPRSFLRLPFFEILCFTFF